MRRDSVLGTFTVAAVLCVVCSLLVASAAVGLKPQQERNKKIDEKKNVLMAAGLCEPTATANEVDAIFADRVQRIIVDLSTGEQVADPPFDPAAYDQRQAAKDPELNEPIPAGELPGVNERARYAVVYEVRDGDNLDQYVFPVHGKGLWSTLYGFLAVDSDRRTIRGITFFEHGETPGLGGEVDNPKWKAQWPSKVAYDENGDVVIRVIKGVVNPASPEADHEIDGLAGATITTKGVSNLVRYWLSDEAFGKFLHGGDSASEKSSAA